MKKTLTAVAVSTALVLGGAVVASAAIELDANVRVRGISSDLTAQEDKPSSNTYDQRAQIGFKSKVSDELTGYIRLSTGTGSDNFAWGANSAGDDYSRPTKNGMNLDEAWIDYKPSSWGIKVGRQHISLGPNFWDRRGDAPDDMIVLYADIAGTKVQAVTIKVNEHTADDNSDDLDAYILTLDRKFNDSFSGGLNYTYLKGAADTGDTATAKAGLALSNLGANANLKFGDLSFALDGNMQFGDAAADVDAAGYAVQINADYKINNSKIGLMFAQGSGDDDATDNDADEFVNYLFSTYRHNTMAGYALAVPGSAKFGNNSGLSNLTIYQLNGSTSVTCPLTGKPLSLRGALNYLETTEDVAVGGNNEDEIGTEIFGVAAWKLNSNLSYQVEASYVWTDDVYGRNNDDAYWIRHGITMNF